MKNNQTSIQVERVQFEFTHSNASTLGVAGTFNKWRPDATPMIHWGDGRWVTELLLAPGTYEYCLVVDGEWMPDPRARETVSNPFGGRNSVLRVASSKGVPSLQWQSTVVAKW
jgi:1,4-alpha-glucan branching enzyme